MGGATVGSVVGGSVGISVEGLVGVVGLVVGVVGAVVGFVGFVVGAVVLSLSDLYAYLEPGSSSVFTTLPSL